MRRIVAGLTIVVALIIGVAWFLMRPGPGEATLVTPLSETTPQPRAETEVLAPAPLPEQRIGPAEVPESETGSKTGTVAGIIGTADRRPCRDSFEVRLRSKSSPDLAVVKSQSVPPGDGSFQFTDVPAGWYIVEAVAGTLAGACNQIRVSPDRPVRGLWIVIRPAGSVSGVVLRSDTGEPIPGARIESSEISGIATEPIRIVVTRTGPDGRFLLTGLPEGVAGISVTAKGFAPECLDGVEIAAGREATGIVVRLGEGGAIHGIVYDPDGTPGPGVKVALVWVIEGKRIIGDLGPVATADENGAFRFENLTPGRYRVRRAVGKGMPILLVDDDPAKEGATEPVLEVREGEVTIFDVRSDLTGVVRGTVMTKDNRPLRRQVNVLDVTGRLLVDGGHERMSVSDEKGGFEIRALPPGEYLLETDDVRTPVKVRAGQTTTVEIVHETACIEGVVQDETGTPVAGAIVRAKRRANSRLSIQVALEPTVRTDSAGRFAFEALTAGKYRLYARKDPASRKTESLALHPGETMRDVVIRLASTIEVRVLVRNAAGEPIEGIPVQLNAQRGSTGPDGVAVFQASPGQAVIFAGTPPDALVQVVQVKPPGGQVFTLTLR